MAISNDRRDYEQIVEKIVFDEEELKDLKITIKKFFEGKIEAKQLKQKLLLCRGRMVKDISHFLKFCIDRIGSDDITYNNKKTAIDNQIITQLQHELKEKSELLELVAKKVQNLLVKCN